MLPGVPQGRYGQDVCLSLSRTRGSGRAGCCAKQQRTTYQQRTPVDFTHVKCTSIGPRPSRHGRPALPGISDRPNLGMSNKHSMLGEWLSAQRSRDETRGEGAFRNAARQEPVRFRRLPMKHAVSPPSPTETITTAIVERLEAGTGSWVQPWRALQCRGRCAPAARFMRLRHRRPLRELL